MRKTIFLSILLISLTSCSIDFNWETDKKIIEPINNNSPSCGKMTDYGKLTCVWWNGTCKVFDGGNIWKDCWNALQ